MTYLDESWFWPVLEHYRSHDGRTVEEVENAWLRASGISVDASARMISDRQWRLSPKSEQAGRNVIQLIEAFQHPTDAFTYLEFGTCFGTTIASVLRRFDNARGIGLEVNPARFEISCWLTKRMRTDFHIADRLTLMQMDVRNAPLQPDSIDIVFMDTNHCYPDDYEYIMHLLNGNVLRKGFLFIGDDPLHTGTNLAREHFIRQHSASYRIITRADKNLWWFFAR